MFNNRNIAGMFDVSHMLAIDIKGVQAQDFLRYLLANDIGKLTKSGKALYSCMLNEKGGVIDDLITYYFDQNRYRLVVNAATCAKDLAWLHKQAQNYSVVIQERTDLAIIAIQGPNARAKANNVLANFLTKPQQETLQALKPFQSVECEDWLIARTGYTGEDGYEIILPQAQAPDFWQALIKSGVHPSGLASRDTLRLEAGLNLYGADMDESTSPLESNLAWTIAWEPESRDFIGKRALQLQKQQGIQKRLVGLVLPGRGVLRNHQKVLVEGFGEGEITSGSFSPTLGQAIALARIPQGDATQCRVDVRGKQMQARIVKPPFVKNGKIMV